MDLGMHGSATARVLSKYYNSGADADADKEKEKGKSKISGGCMPALAGELLAAVREDLAKWLQTHVHAFQASLRSHNNKTGNVSTLHAHNQAQADCIRKAVVEG